MERLPMAQLYVLARDGGTEILRSPNPRSPLALAQPLCLEGLGTAFKPPEQQYCGPCGAAMLLRWRSLHELRLSYRTPPNGATIVQ